MADSPEEFSTPKLLNGEGDGIKNITVRRRLPTSSSRKFNARVNPDVTFKSKIGNALSELQTKSHGHSCLKKSQSVAEITPSKRKVKKRPITTTSGDYTAVTLHATPRPMDGSPTSPPRRCLRERAVCTVYQRLLLCVWRRSRARLATLSDSCGRQQDQIGQLEIQVDVLKNLRNSESQKRTEALNDSQQLKKKIDVMELEKCRLSERLRNTQEELENTQTNLNLTKLELKKCSEQIGSYQEQVKRKKEERIDLLTKISTQDYEINKKNSIIYRLEGELKTIEKNLQNSESSFRAKQEEYNEVLHQLQDEVELNYSLNEQMLSLQENKLDLESQTRDLENQLSEYIESCEQLRDENTTIKSDLNEISFVLLEEKRKTWFKNTKEIAALSLTALQKVAYVLLPAYLDNPV